MTNGEGERFRCQRYRCDLRVSDCVDRQVKGISGCENCLQGVNHAHAAGVPVKVSVRPRCQAPGCTRSASWRHKHCEGHRKQLRVWGVLRPLRSWTRRGSTAVG